MKKFSAVMCENNFGEYVSIDDYDSLMTELEEANSEIERLKDKIHDLEKDIELFEGDK